MVFTVRRPLCLILTYIIFAALSLASCEAEEIAYRPNLYQCEGCAGIFERDHKTLSPVSVIAAATESGDRMILTGQVFATDGKTPVPGVIIYAYQTNSAGLYAGGSTETEWSRRHGRLRGWLKTDETGSYIFKTIKPAPYPNNNMPAHIHFTILEKGKKPYWIDDIVFEGEFGVTDNYRQKMIHQGGNGITSLKKTKNGTWLAKRDIILERHQ